MRELISDCPIEVAMNVLGGRWPTLVLYYLKDRPKRFSELRRDNPTISHRILTLVLRELEGHGLVARHDAGGFPRRVDYALTPAGARVLPLIDAIGEWWDQTAAERAACSLEAAA